VRITNFNILITTVIFKRLMRFIGVIAMKMRIAAMAGDQRVVAV